jgi:hypothetical protein
MWVKTIGPCKRDLIPNSQIKSAYLIYPPIPMSYTHPTLVAQLQPKQTNEAVNLYRISTQEEWIIIASDVKEYHLELLWFSKEEENKVI